MVRILLNVTRHWGGENNYWIINEEIAYKK